MPITIKLYQNIHKKTCGEAHDFLWN